ncbi:protocatechuate 3,4-dioxygenase subunit alpha [Salinisphaera sp. SPP-AMP-43]|uniref:protocatechuate 3,4-dioxygenase subunit alpha n=1 Tax=Salinisphaera sp. SPP-AMP-43 TaxID=3121288 RepID=UPI003C6DEACC
MQQYNHRQPLDPNSVFLPETPSQTAGPYVHIGLALNVAGLPEREHEIANVMAGADAEGQRIHLHGLVLDGNDLPVEDVLIETWQADAQGRYVTEFSFDNAFNSFGRAAPGMGVDRAGGWSFATVKPGRVGHPDGSEMAPHINLMVFARGINIHLHTRVYFEDEAEANQACPFLNRVPAERRPTLIATRSEDSQAGEPVYEFVIRLQGQDETVFFDF